MFGMSVHNYDAAGNLQPDPVENNKTYPTENLAIQAYEEFLSKWTSCGINPEGQFVEEDNDLAPPPPPPPPDLDSPSSETTSIKGFADDGVGAW